MVQTVDGRVCFGSIQFVNTQHSHLLRVQGFATPWQAQLMEHVLSPKTVGKCESVIKCQCQGTMTLGCSGTRELNSMPETTLRCIAQFWNGNFDRGPQCENAHLCWRKLSKLEPSLVPPLATVWDVAFTKILCEYGNKSKQTGFERNSIMFLKSLVALNMHLD